METIKAGKPAIEFVKRCYRANTLPRVSGPHGVGKSERLEEAARALGIGIIVRDLSVLEPPDLVGLPKMNGKTTVYSPPDFLPTSGEGILLFEELNRCERYVRAPCLQPLTARTLNDYQLPNGWLPAAAINPAGDAYEVFDLDPALLSRFATVGLVPDQQEWLAWGRQNGIHPAVIDYVSADPSVFDSSEGNPRAWKTVSDVLRANEDQPTDREILRAVVVGLVGDERGVAFLRTLRHGKRPLAAEKILHSYRDHRAQVRRWIKEGRLDLVRTTLLAVEKYLQPKREYALVKEDRGSWKNLAAFLHDLPGDLLESARNWFREREYAFPRQPRTR